MIEAIRIPSEGSEFSLKEIIFTVKKTNSTRLIAEAIMDSITLFNTKEVFKIFGVKYKIFSFKYNQTSKKAILKAAVQ